MIGVVAAILVFATFMVVLNSEPFPSSTVAHSEFIPTEPGAEIGSSMSKFLWDFRGFDLAVRSVIRVTTAMCCLARLREESRK